MMLPTTTTPLTYPYFFSNFDIRGVFGVLMRICILSAAFIAAILIHAHAKINPKGFDILWRYFAWANQTIAIFAFAMITVYLRREKTVCYSTFARNVLYDGHFRLYFECEDWLQPFVSDKLCDCRCVDYLICDIRS